MLNFFTKNKIILSFIIFISLIILNSVIIFRNPWYDWDIVCYTGIVKMIDNPDIKQVHKDTYKELRQELNKERYDITKMANHYRVEVFNNAQTFYDQFPFYTIKFIYTYTVYSIHKFVGISIVKSIVMTSILSYIAISVLLFALFLPEIRKNILFAGALYVFMSFGQMLIGGRSTTPDMLGVLFLFVGMIFILKRQIILGLIILVLSLGTRTDNIIFILLTLGYLKFFVSKEFKINYVNFILFGLLTALTYKAINTYFENFGYIKLFYHSFIDQIYHPATDTVFLSFGDYFEIFKSKLRIMLSLDGNRPESFLFLYVLIGIISVIYAKTKNLKLDNIYVGLIYLSISSLAIRFVLFPNIQERYFIFYFLIIFISMVKIMFFEENKNNI